MSLVALTPTGARPWALQQTARYLERQTRRPDLWIVVDDGPERSGFSYSGRVMYLRRTPVWQPGQVTLQANLRAGLAGYDPDAHSAVAIIEDDDWYAPDYLEWLAGTAEARNLDLFGEGRSAYYNVATRCYSVNDNTHHASLCATLARGKAAVEALRAATLGYSPFVDIELWRTYKGPSQVDSGERRRHVGLKGLPGRGGIGAGHRMVDGPRDDSGAVLRSWIGADAAAYLGG